MDFLLEALDSLFLQDEVDLAYSAYSNFETLKKEANVSMNDYIIEYERLYGVCKKHKMDYPDSVLAFKLLDNAGLSEKERQLVLTAASDRKFSSMKSALKRIFGGSSETEITVKQEAFMTKSFSRNRESSYSDQNGSSYQQRKNKQQKGTNPLDRNGKRTKCAICESVYHWARNCPHKQHKQEVRMTETEVEEQDDDDEERCNLTLFTKEHATVNEVLMTEAYGCAVIDTACTKTVCGKRWFEQYVDKLSANQKKNMKTRKSVKTFTFGDGAKIHSYINAKIPAQIGNRKCNIETEVVDVEIPLLLSKESLKKAETVLDMTNDKVTMFQQPVELNFTSTGHYCIDILGNNQESEKECEILLMMDNLDEEEQTKALVKLHKQFGHSSSESLRKLMQNAGIKNPDLYKKMTELVKECDVCARHKKTPPKPTAGLPLADDYNQTVAVDLHEIRKNLWYFHMIDVYSRFSAATIIISKESSVIVQNFMKYWIAIHGPPKTVISDNGREFSNGEFQDMCENFNIEVKTTAAYSPWSNGVVERHNQTLSNMLIKIKKDKKELNWETALCWALAAKNSMVNTHGFSPYQLVYGRNPNFPSVLTNKLPALEGTTRSKTVGEHITSLHVARKAFTEAESSERIRRALRKQTRSSFDIYKMGDKIYYKRPDGEEWKGPGTIIGQDGSVIFVRHGGTLVRVHQSRIQRVKEDTKQEKITPVVEQDSHSQSTSRETKKKQEETRETKNSCAETTSETESETETDDMNESNVDLSKLKPGKMISYEHMDDRKRISAKILNKAGKSSGRNKHWFNIQCTEPEEYEGERMSVDLTKVNKLVVSSTEPESTACSDQNDNVMMIEGVCFDEAKQQELENWKINHVYTEVENTGQKCVSTRWICTLKESKEGVIPKARLVARGFEEIGNENMQKDSPTCTSESLKVFLSIFAQRKWTPCSIDIKTAFLQGKEINRDIFVRPPKEANSRGKLWHLQKCVYGLNDASLQWYKKVKDVLQKLGGRVSKVDPAVFIWMKGNEVEGNLACHVDDFIWGGAKHFEKTVVDEIRKSFQVGKEENRAFQYIGLELSSDGNTVSLQQTKYGNNLEPIPIAKKRTQQKQDDMTVEEKQAYRSKVGQILWTSRQSRPDVSFDACQLASNIKDGKVKHLIEANKVIKRIKSEHVELKFHHLRSGPLKLIVYTAASFGNLNNGGTQGGYIIFLANENGDIIPICWNSKKIHRVVRSTLAGETLAMAEGIDEAIFVATLFTEITTGKATTDGLPLICMTDCKSLHDALKSTKQVTEKRLRLEISGIKDLMEKGIVKQVKWSDTQRQLADCLTKRGASSTVLLKALEDGKITA